jgi:adenylate cyclase
MMPDSELDPSEDYVFAEENDPVDPGEVNGYWKLLVVDDEADVHKATRLALADFVFQGRKLRMYSAYSAGEARDAIVEHPDTAVILLDVVMETDDAGLKFVRFVRSEAKNHLVRIILRTGQPGQAPERRVILEYDINDYKHKAELTARGLFTAIVASLRSYHDLDYISRFTNALGRFVPHELTRLLGKPSIIDVSLGDHIQRDMAILFSDLRSFTTLSERLTPEEAFQFLNNYLEEIGPITRAHNGYIDKYVGDAILAIFPGGADDALQAAIDMQTKVDEFNLRREEAGELGIQVGIGVHAGPLILGVIGERERMEGTVVADCVNLASRLENLCKEFGVRIVTTEECLATTKDPGRYATRRLGTLPVRGKSHRVPAYEVFDCDAPDVQARKLATRDSLAHGLECLAAGELEEATHEFRLVVEALPDDPVALDYLAQATTRRRASLLGHDTLTAGSA